MDKPTTTRMTDEHSCIICEKLDSSSENNSDLGDIIKISRKVTTLRTAEVNDLQDGLLPHLRICVLKKTDEELQNCMNYELAPYPLCLFEVGELRKTKKSTFYELFPEISINLKGVENVHYVIDGGMLLHRCRWQLNETFKMVCKIKFAKNFEESHDLHESAEVFKNVNENSNNIFQAGVTCILGLHGASTKIKDLNTWRYNSFIKAMAKNTSVLLSSLPPTTDAAFEPLKRVYLQIQIWLGNDVDIDNWGWKHFNNMLIPITMNQLPAPDHLVQILFCNRKKGCAAACGCRKSSLYCSVECLQCSENSCSNTPPIIQINEVEEDIPLAVQVMIEDLGKIIAVPMGVNNSEAEIRGAIEYNESIVLCGSRVDIWEI
ncbi:uncharacterized protein TNCT_385631 [Trichonephila clavata]|uniref:Tesmin/TSO1-like CXC domain-containing protein n=1 Tax=Trichonephila clavata TaxID=2740835 RepID=A0A8X6HP87_TRICU|nr:uncharacterized protein TNCT_385631 [Trichonephila clavata]